MTLWNKFCKADSTFDVCKSHQLRFLSICLIRKVIFPIKKPLTHFQSVSTYTFSLSLFISLSLSLSHTISLFLSLTHKNTQHTLFFLSLTHIHTRPLSLSRLPFHSLCISQCSWHTYKRTQTYTVSHTTRYECFYILTLSLFKSIQVFLPSPLSLTLNTQKTLTLRLSHFIHCFNTNT